MPTRKRLRDAIGLQFMPAPEYTDAVLCDGAAHKDLTVPGNAGESLAAFISVDSFWTAAGDVFARYNANAAAVVGAVTDGTASVMIPQEGLRWEVEGGKLLSFFGAANIVVTVSYYNLAAGKAI
jgi:hypothetical protein